MDFNYFRKKLKELDYPTNHHYDPETFKPIGIMKKRTELLEKNAPELLKGNESLLDIGSNKGFISFYLKDKYKEIVGYEPDKNMVDFSEELRKKHNINNIKFCHGSFDDIPLYKKYDVVYVGNCHHYLFRDDIRCKRPFFFFLHKLKELCNEILILDGIFNYTDYSMLGMADDEKWTNDIKKIYIFKNFRDELIPEFRIIRSDYNGIGKENSKRYTTVFERVNGYF